MTVATTEPPKTRQILQLLEKQINDGTLAPGDRLYSAREIARQFEVSTAVSMSVYKALEKKGLVVREPGRGIFVKSIPRPADNSINILAWSAIFPINRIQHFFASPDFMPAESLNIEPFYTDQYENYDKYLAWIGDYCSRQPAANALAILDEGLLPVLAEQNLLYPLNDLLKSSPVFSGGGFPDKLLRCMSYKGKIYGLPVTYSPTVLFYNRRIFASAGIAEPDGRWDWQRLLDVALQLTEADDDGQISRYGLGIVFSVNAYSPLIYQNNGDIFDRSGSCAINSDESFEALSFFSRLYSLPGVCTHKFGDARSALVDLMSMDLLGMIIGDAHDYKILQKKISARDWGMVQLPWGGRKPATALSIHGWGILRRSADPQAVFKVLERIYDPALYPAFCDFSSGLPAFMPEARGVPKLMREVIPTGNVSIPSSSPQAFSSLQATLSTLLSHKLKLTRAKCSEFQDKINAML